MAEEELLKLANGDVYLADEALEHRLIDAIGYFDDAVARVRELTGLEQLRVVELRKRWRLTDLLELQLSSPRRDWSLLGAPDPIPTPRAHPPLLRPRFYYAYGVFAVP